MRSGVYRDKYRCLALAPDYALAYYIRGLIAQEEGDERAVRSNWHRALELDPEASNAQQMRDFLEGR